MMTMKMIRYSLAVLLFFSLNACRKDDAPPPPTPPPVGTDEPIYPKKEMRAVWMATVFGLDWPEGKYTVAAQKKHYTDYLDKFKELNINAVFVQIKGMGDAFYNSPYEPWSAAITGTRGTDPGYDVLKFMIDEAHTRGMEFHAWMNPYRIATRTAVTTSYPALHASVNADWVVSHEKIQIYNPALPEVRQRLADIVKDVITKYDVDGIHFDDYFYPDPSSAGQMVSDDADYQKYGAGTATKEDFRRSNVDKAIKGVYDVIVATKPQVVFSVSPAPDPDYNFKTLFADVRKWNEQGWLDVVIPQLYQEIGNRFNDFQTRLNWWSQYNYKAALMVGHGYYKFGDGTSPAAFQSTLELEKQFEMTRRNQKVVGNLLYSAKYIPLNKIGITNKLADIFKAPAVIPFLGRSVAPAPAAATNVSISGNTLKWNTTGNVRSVVYYFADLKKEGVVLAVTTGNELPVTAAGHYSVSTINVDNLESKPSAVIKK
ncbi:family 10 glycosylhydrolase [Flavisolibacter sp. BT320]|nr:family 10 glycosylhydrolase [Flavisolibacter longurius]